MQLRHLNYFFIVLLAVNTSVYAQASVEEDESSSSSSSLSSSSMSMGQRVEKLERQMQNQASLLKQLDTATQQIKDLQGQLEIQAHDIKILKEQQKSQYSDLDARLNSFSHKTTEHADSADDKKSGNTTGNKIKKDSSPVLVNDDKGEKAYQAAYALLKNKNYDKAKIAFQKFIRFYPNDSNIVDAHYWLGNIYLLKNQPSDAISELKTVVKIDKSHTKTADALFKLGLAYSMQGDAKQARIQFKKVKQNYPQTQAAKLASEKLGM